MKQKGFSFLLIGCIFLAGCGIKDKVYTASEAEKKIVTFCQKESSNSTAFTAEEFTGPYNAATLLEAIKATGIAIPEGKDDTTRLNNLLKNKDTLRKRFSHAKLPGEANELLHQKTPLTGEQQNRLNRLIIETAFTEKCPKSLTVITRTIGKTLWIYSPFGEPLFSVKASSRNEQVDRKPSPFALLYLDGLFDEKKNISLSYDIIADVLPPDPVTYGSAYNENYARRRQLIYQSLQESIFNMAPQDAPVFVVVLVADIKTGIAIKNTFNLLDFKKYTSDALPFDEYYFREKNEVFGDEALIGDARGSSLKYTDIVWVDFLIDQIKSRIRFKFTQSDFSADKDPDKVITALAANTLSYYPEFTDYSGLYLYNIRAKREMLFNKTQLKTFVEKSPWENKAKFTTIHFDAGKITTDDKDSKSSSELID